MIPLQPIFWIDSTTLRTGRYRDLITDYRTKLTAAVGQPGDGTPWSGLPRPLAFIRLTDADKPLLSDCIDHLLANDVQPIAQDGTHPKERGQTDLHWLLDRPEADRTPFVFFVREPVRIQPANGNALLAILQQAVQTLHSHKQVLSVGFPSVFSFLPIQQVSELYSVAPTLKWPAVLRTRDLYLAASLAGNQNDPLQVLGAFSGNPAKHLAFAAAVATTL